MIQVQLNHEKAEFTCSSLEQSVLLPKVAGRIIPPGAILDIQLSGLNSAIFCKISTLDFSNEILDHLDSNCFFQIYLAVSSQSCHI